MKKFAFVPFWRIYKRHRKHSIQKHAHSKRYFRFCLFFLILFIVHTRRLRHVFKNVSCITRKTQCELRILCKFPKKINISRNNIEMLRADNCRAAHGKPVSWFHTTCQSYVQLNNNTHFRVPTSCFFSFLITLAASGKQLKNIEVIGYRIYRRFPHRIREFISLRIVSVIWNVFFHSFVHQLIHPKFKF